MYVVTANLRLHNPISEHSFYVLVEVSGSNSKHDEEKLSNFVEKLVKDALIVNGTMATEFRKMKVSYKQTWQKLIIFFISLFHIMLFVKIIYSVLNYIHFFTLFKII